MPTAAFKKIDTPNVDVTAISKEGLFYVLDDYALRDERYTKVVDTFLDGVTRCLLSH
jgi:hypothetical protein